MMQCCCDFHLDDDIEIGRTFNNKCSLLMQCCCDFHLDGKQQLCKFDRRQHEWSVGGSMRSPHTCTALAPHRRPPAPRCLPFALSTTATPRLSPLLWLCGAQITAPQPPLPAPDNQPSSCQINSTLWIAPPYPCWRP
eukprot:311379-Chlamydomonas_euryale.AAC.1